jgi:murein DD-endopeptidase MepM/ murein hydrolase activator NlpD
MASERTSRRLDAAALALWAVAGCATLRAPAPAARDGPPRAVYVVQPGDTLAGLATRHHVPVEDLAEINGLVRGQALRAGQLIFLLAPEGPLPAARPSAEKAPALASLRRADPPPTPALRWPLVEPRLSSGFGARWGRPHEGIDLAAPVGTPIHAAEAGEVIYAGDEVKGYGNMVVLSHPGGLVTVYAHSSVLLVRTGDHVTQGQEIARVGQSGRATAPHLHFEVRRAKVPLDPLRFLAPIVSGAVGGFPSPPATPLPRGKLAAASRALASARETQ